jgi:DNA segregation ATPase FtsK/SpoIIIE, S-DNA-T family
MAWAEEIFFHPGIDIETDTDVELALSRAPHMLVAGMTGSGKSTLVHRLIREAMGYRDIDIGLVLIDPKRVEFSQYIGDPHLVDRPVYDIDRIRIFLEWAVNEMMIRFTQMETSGYSDIVARNSAFPTSPPWSRILVVIDELANLILADKHLEKPIVKLASMGRAAGIHLLLATQRPSADVLTGLIRANVPTRFCLPVVTKMDSRIVLDKPGAELLSEPGEMIARLPGERQLRWMKVPR